MHRALCAFLLVATAAAAGASSPHVVRFGTETMGTWGTIAVVTADSAAVAPAAAEALEAFVAVDRRFSNWTTTSELARINRELPHGPVRLSGEAVTVVGRALAVARASGGAFDPTVEPLVRLWGFLGGTPAVPRAEAIEALLARTGHDRLVLDGDVLTADGDGDPLKLDLGGIAKGHAVDRAAAVLRARGIENALIDLSGNMIGLGHPPGRAHWKVGVRDPESDDAWFATLSLGAEAIATSGNYEQFVDVDGRRYGHVLDPRTGWPVDDLVSVTVLAPTAIEADAWATALLVLGCEGAKDLLADRDDLAAVLVQSARDGSHRVWVEDSLRDRFGFVMGAPSRFEQMWFGEDHDEPR